MRMMPITSPGNSCQFVHFNQFVLNIEPGALAGVAHTPRRRVKPVAQFYLVPVIVTEEKVIAVLTPFLVFEHWNFNITFSAEKSIADLIE